MRIRGWIAFALCAGALTWQLAGPARADGQPAGAGGPLATDAAAGDREALKDTADFAVVDEVPRALKSVHPKYPEEARKRRVQGTVFVRALVKKDGLTTGVSVVAGKGVSPELDRAALDAVRQWVFEPAKAKGKPVAVWVVIPVSYKLK